MRRASMLWHPWKYEDAMPLTPDQRRQLRTQCELIVPGFAAPGPAEEFRALAHWFDANDQRHDHYGEGELVQGFERKVAALLGKPAALFVPSGVMAQLIALRIWTEAARLDRFGIHPTSHLVLRFGLRLGLQRHRRLVRGSARR